jgi:excisionase family DNA binding protein
MSDFNDSIPAQRTDLQPPSRNSRMSVPEIASRLAIGRQAVYDMLEQGILPGIRFGRRWIITRHAYETWEKTCGTTTPAQEPAARNDFTSIPGRGRTMVCQ